MANGQTPQIDFSQYETPQPQIDFTKYEQRPNFQMRGAKGSKGGALVTIPPTGSIPVPPSTDPTLQSDESTLGRKVVGVAREGALGLASGFSGLPESTSPVSDAVKSMAIPPPPSADSLASAAVGPAYGIAKGLLTGGAEAVKGGYSTVKGLLTGNPEAAWEGAQQGAHGLGSTIGQALQIEMGRAGANPEEAAAYNATKGTKAYGKGLNIPSSPEAAALASKTAPEGVNLARDMQVVAQKDLSKISRESPITTTGSAASFQHAKAIYDYADKLWEEGHQAPIARNIHLPGKEGNIEAIADAGRKILRDEDIGANPADVSNVEKLNKWIDTDIDKPRSLGQLDGLLRGLNRDLSKLTPQSNLPYGELGPRVQSAIARAIRSEIETRLTDAGEQGVKDVNTRYGALVNIADRATKAGLSEATAEGKKGAIPPWIRAYSFMHQGPEGLVATGGASVHPQEMFPSTPSKNIIKGSRRLGQANLEPTPIVTPPRPTIHGLLPAPPTQLPYADTSGPIPPTPSGEPGLPVPRTVPDWERASVRASYNPPPPTAVGALPPPGFPAAQPLPNPAASARNMWDINPPVSISTSEGLYGENAAAEARRQAMGGQGRLAPRSSFGPGGEARSVIGQGTYMGRPEGKMYDVGGPPRNPPTGIVASNMKSLGLEPQLLTKQMQSTLETMIRGPRWKGMEGVDKVAAINRIISGAKF